MAKWKRCTAPRKHGKKDAPVNRGYNYLTEGMYSQLSDDTCSQISQAQPIILDMTYRLYIGMSSGTDKSKSGVSITISTIR
ncbi:hypothetical protein H6P81_004428 [Aristolochia fimbriata]|uniref:Uncharacterized protein n=1 Tax=Aristolochia fimbriata TaxID=158543 RepID=A0AAV7FFD0_ARIFI|nr:hypothetical protein H6P81_004428 [Aristolochia fimbriata]